MHFSPCLCFQQRTTYPTLCDTRFSFCVLIVSPLSCPACHLCQTLCSDSCPNDHPGFSLFQHSGPAGPAPNSQHTGLPGLAFKSHSTQSNKPGASAYGPQQPPFCGQREAPNSWPALSSCGLVSSSCIQQQPELPLQQGLCSGFLGHHHQPAAAPLARAGGWAQL